MPPEQMRNAREADHRSDIYSLGATLYHLATLQLPIKAKTYQEFIKELNEQAPPLVTEFDPSFPPALAAIIARCMQKNPALRFQQSTELERQLIAIREGLGVDKG